MKKTVGKPPKGTQGVITRGKTAHNRLRRVDTFVLLYARECLTSPDALFVDLGYGEEAITTLESAQRFRKVNGRLPVVGVEIDPGRVAAGKPFEDEQTSFRLGGFNLPLREGECPTVIRAFNVLRQYNQSDVMPAWQTLAASMADGGLLIEGTSDPFGRIWTANLIQKRT
ncbi:MAG TPA: class I SAM-dependent methyltransferase, partial [Chloroflexi bacterium]|nr:class I SAM-dependent methyltransferase [Chloroflexota bacterium]